MRVTSYTDYSLRVLMYVGVKGEGVSTVNEIAEGYRISKNHLMKVVHKLGLLGYLETVRGKGGGIRLARPARCINIGAVVRDTEDDLALVDCLQPSGGTCRIRTHCRLRHALQEALHAFFHVLDGYTLADLIESDRPFARLLGLDVNKVGGHAAVRPR